MLHFFAQTISCYSLKSPHRDISLSIHKIYFDSDENYFFHHENIPIYFDPLKPHFYIVKLGFTGVFIIFLISAQTIDCGYSLEPPHRGGSNECPHSMF